MPIPESSGLRRFLQSLRLPRGVWAFVLLAGVFLVPLGAAWWPATPPPDFVPTPRSTTSADGPLPRILPPRQREGTLPRDPSPVEPPPVERPPVRPAEPPRRTLRCRAVDGDTLRCGAERVRLVGLDTPEMQGRCPAESRLARRAQARLAALAADGVTLQPEGRDRYDRLLAVVRDRAGRDLASIMIREGLARPYGGGRRAGWC